MVFCPTQDADGAPRGEKKKKKKKKKKNTTHKKPKQKL